MTIDDQIRILERFNEKVGRLKSRGFVEESQGGGAIVEWRKGRGWDGLYAGPCEKTAEATVLTLRFFIQDNESTSLRRMAKLYSSVNFDPWVSKQFFAVKDQINCYLDTPSNLWISEEGPMTHRHIFELFVYGDLAHTNQKMETDFRSIRQTAFFPLFQEYFTRTVQRLMSALDEMQRINCLALDQLRRGGTSP